MPHLNRNGGPWLALAAAVAVGFGLLTLRAGGAVLFGGDEARRAAGDYVGFVVWSNFIAAFAYVVAGAGLWARRRWAAWLALAILAATVLTFAALGIHAASGGAYESRTVAAMSLRTLVWLAISGAGWRWIGRAP